MTCMVTPFPKQLKQVGLGSSSFYSPSLIEIKHIMQCTRFTVGFWGTWKGITHFNKVYKLIINQLLRGLPMSSLFNNFFPKSEEYPYEMSNSGTLLRKQKKKIDPTCGTLCENDNGKVPQLDETKVETDPVATEVPKVDETKVETDPVATEVPKVDETKVETDPVATEVPKVDQTKVETDPVAAEVPKADETRVQTDLVDSEVPKVDNPPTQPDSSTDSVTIPIQETLEEGMNENIVKEFNVNVEPSVQEPVNEEMNEKVDEKTLISKSLCDIINDEEISMFDLIDLTSSKVVPDAKLRDFFSMLKICQTHDRRGADKLIADINLRANHSFTVLDLLKIHFFVTNSFSFELVDDEGDIVTSILEFRPY